MLDERASKCGLVHYAAARGVHKKSVRPHHAKLGLSDQWAYRAIKQVGNYGEIFERNVGEKTPLKLSRGPNALWTKGGLMYAMPAR